MNTAAFLFALIGFAVTFGSLIHYFRTIPRLTVPVKVGGFAAQLGVGVLLSAIAVYLGITGSEWAGLPVYLPAGLAILLGSFILWVLTQRKIPLGDITVKEGDAILPFAAKTSDGATFDSAELQGKRVLLKFFRGGWCPYCAAELIAFKAMQPELGKHGVTLIALSKDTPEEATVHKTRDDLDFTLLCDPGLSVIRAYGLEHHKAFGFSNVPKTNFFGIPMGFAQMNFRTMAIPTTLLIDETGIIRWIDQTDDYRLRSSIDRVLSAVRQAFSIAA